MSRLPCLTTSLCRSLAAALLGAFVGCSADAPPAGSQSAETGLLAEQPIDEAGPPVHVAVVRFEDRGTSIEFNRLGAAMAEMLGHDLGQFRRIRILERTASGELISERNLAEAQIASEGAGNSEKLGAEYLITGSCTAASGKLVVTASLAKVGSRTPPQTWEHAGAVDDFLRFETALVKQLSQALGARQANHQNVSPAPRESSPTLAIVRFTNQGPSANLDILQEGFPELLQASLSAVEGMRLVERSQIETVLAEQNLSLSGLVDPETVVQVGHLLRAERLLVGSFLELGPNFSIQTRLIDADTGAVVASQRVSGARKSFAQLMEDLTIDIVNDLSLSQADDANASIRAALPARSLEAAVHLATATRRMSEGKRPQAVEAYQQVLLLEPGNIACYARQLAALWELGRLNDIQRIGNQALGRKEFAAAPPMQRLEILWKLAYAYSAGKRYDDLVRVTDRIVAVFPDAVHNVNSLRASTLMQLNRYEEGIKLMESATAGDPDPATDWKNLGLQEQFRFYAFGMNDWRVPKSLRTTEKTREGCQRAMQIFDRILVSAAGKRDRDARAWAELFVPNLAAYMMYVDKQGYNRLYLSPAERADAMRRALEVFDWDPVTAAEGSLSLGINAEEAQLWEEALVGYRGFLEACPQLEQVDGVHQGSIPSPFDSQILQPNTWVDRKIEAYYRLAKIEQGLGHLERAAQAYQDMVREVGLTNFRGAQAVASMAKLNLEPEYPEQCALVWGWDSNGQRSWERVLGPAGYKVHSLRVPVVTSAQLAPYTIVILVRSGNRIFTPTEMLALRSYVAEGGSLLAIVSPGWEPAAPVIHNGLLSFFDMEVGAALPPKIAADRLAAHPITAGITQATAKCGAALRAPPESLWIAAEGGGLLAAREYRFGRVVVAAFGQWLLPEPSIFPGGWQRFRVGHWTFQVSPADLPFDTGPNLCRPLLDHVVRWLGERRPQGPEYSSWKTELAAAHWIDWRVHARDLPWSAMAEPHQRLIAAAFDPASREESLWSAGEAYFNLRCFPDNDPFMQPTYGRVPQTAQDPEPRHYQQLIESFPDSPLLHFAQWRLADCQRVPRLFQRGRSDPAGNADRDLIAAFDKVSAKHGAYAWAWARLRQATLAVRMRDLSVAIQPLRDVVNSMPHGPERTLALAMLAECLAKTGQAAEARRMFEELSSLPLISWDRIGDGLSDWYPMTSTHNSSREISLEGLRDTKP